MSHNQSKTAQHSVHPAGGSRRVFRQVSWLQVDSVEMALSHPTHQRVTPAVSPLSKIHGQEKMNNQSKNKKSIPSENSAGEVKALKAKVEQLEKQLQNELTTSSKSKTSAEFMLSEFNELGQFWRHTDARLESGINLYMTASALIISGLAYLSQQVTDFKAFLFFVILIAFALFIGGLILAERIVGVGFVKTEYIYGLNLIRRYFVDVDPAIKDYLVLPTASNPKSKKVFEPKVSKLLLGFIHGWDSLLLGFVAGSITWLLMPQIDIRIVITIGIIVATLGFAILSLMVWARKKRAG